MVTYVFDACTVLRYLDGQAGSDRVEEILVEAALGKVRVILSAIQWGEIINMVLRRHGLENFMAEVAKVRGLALFVESVTDERAERAARIKFEQSMPYADAFAVELAADSVEHILLTSDFDMKRAEKVVRIEFLPRKEYPDSPLRKWLPH